MLPNFKKIVVFFFLMSVSAFSYAQEGNEYCFHQEIKNGTPKFLSYLFKKYGVELSEKILLNVKSYEAQHDVFVFYKSNYQLIMEKIQMKIQQTTDAAIIESLNAKKSKIVLFDTIESIVNH